MYKRALHSFFLKVHPDFFSQNRTLQSVNERSIAQLNELLGWAKDFKTGTSLRPPPAPRISLTFYQKPVTEEESVAQTIFKSPLHEHDVITSTFELPATFAPNEANKGVAERSVNKFLRDLLRKANCMDPVVESASVASDETTRRLEVKPLRRKRSDTYRKPGQESKTLLDDAADIMSEKWFAAMVPTVEELMEADQVLFDRNLSPVQCAAAMSTLTANLGDLQYHQWETMPLIVSDRWSVGKEVSGTLTVPWNFDLVQFLSFLTNEAETIKECKVNAFGFAAKIEEMISQLCRDLNLDDILISCKHSEAHKTLLLMREMTPLLLKNDVTSVTLEIGDAFGVRANGVVIFDKNASSSTLMEAVVKLSPRMAHQRTVYKLATDMLQSTTWHLKEFRDMAQPFGIDGFHNDDSYAHRLIWSKELYSIGPQLAQWDWSPFTFVLSPTVDINWTTKCIMLPYNFDGASFLKYVEGIHKNAKDTAMDEMLEASSQKRQYEESMKSLTSAQPRSQEESDKDHRASSNRDPNFLLKRPNKEELSAAQPHLEEYLASSPTGNDQHSVERPLFHSPAFASQSEEEAFDQLKWEGFYEKTTFEAEPLGIRDDMETMFRNSKRTFREEAVKGALKELREKYGRASVKNRAYLKMGDMLGLNDPNLKVPGYPTVAKGTYQGDKKVSTTPY